eukprot:8827836-Alexandrium_andersonii.AAC.1
MRTTSSDRPLGPACTIIGYVGQFSGSELPCSTAVRKRSSMPTEPGSDVGFLNIGPEDGSFC